MNRDELKKLGLEEAQINAIMEQNGKDIETAKKDYDAISTELDTTKTALLSANTTLEQANTEIQNFKNMDVESIQTAADDWKQKYETAEQTRLSDLAQMKKDSAIQAALLQAKSKNTTAVKSLLNLDAITVTGNEVIGLNEQLEKLKTENDYLFEANQSDIPTFTIPTGDKQEVPTKSLKMMNYSERLQLKKEQPNLYEQMK